MKTRILSLIFIASVAVACGGSQPANQTANSVAPAEPRTAGAMAVPSHGSSAPATEAPAADGRSKWRQSGTPVDAAKVDADIARAEKEFKGAEGNSAKKKALANAYFARGELLRDNAQYASALGDYRKTLKHDPSNAKAKERIEEIVGIYNSMNREYPPEGEEPEALRKQ